MVARLARPAQAGQYALNLWPLDPRRVRCTATPNGEARKRQPRKLLATPGLTLFDAHDNTDPVTGMAVVTAQWLSTVGAAEFEALRLAPPVLEIWRTRGRLDRREVIDFGLAFPLSSASGAAQPG